MKEAFGGVINLFFIALFLVIVMGILGLVVSYTKAFRMKSAIISIVEEYEGAGCFRKSGELADSSCLKKIIQKSQDLGYNPVSLDCGSGADAYYKSASGKFCFKVVKERTKNHMNYQVFNILTQVDINFPIIERIMGFRVFQVSGDTKEMRIRGNKTH